MYAILLAAMLGQVDVPNKGAVVFGPMSGTYSDWVYAQPSKKDEKVPSKIQKELDKLLAQFNRGPNAVHIPRRRFR